MLQELIDAVNAYRLKHSESEAIGGRGVEGLNDTYANMLAVCDAAEQSVQRMRCTCRKNFEGGIIRVDPNCPVIQAAHR